MDKIFGSKRWSKTFMLIVALLILVAFLLRYFVFPIQGLKVSVNTNFMTFFERFITSVFTAVFVGYILYWVQVDEKKKNIEFTESRHEIEKHLSKERETTKSWCFNGGLGRYSRSDTIPELSEIARKDRRTIPVSFIVINPFNITLLEKYIDFRISVESPGKKGKWVQPEVQSEILATIISALYHKRINQFLTLNIGIKDFFTLSRMDISSSLAVITREDPVIPSILAESDSYMYKHYAEEFQQVYRQSKILDYSFPGLELPTQAEVLACINSLFPGQNISNDLLALVYKKFTEPESPF